MKTLITTLIIAFSIMYALSQDLSGVWHGFAKNPDNKEILFVLLFEKNQEIYNTTKAVPSFDVSDNKPKATSLKEGNLTIDGAEFGMKYEGAWNETTNQIDVSPTVL